MDAIGSFETHFTLKVADAGEVIDWAQRQGMKLTHIVLLGGEHPSQPMITRHSSGRLQVSRAEAQRIATQLQSMGAEVLRIKIEMDADNPAAPADASDAMLCPPICYFEHHIKLLLAAGEEHTLLTEIANRHGARVSRNALRHREDSFEERFLTQRLYRQGRNAASAALERLQFELKNESFTILETEAEYVIFDSNVDLDAGWLSSP
ncbi:hypothetical protein DES53_101324 [Roseimicrobium gellanilyticum]|uniref:Uncharacterized protein n=2 Tax=Roseimicrobium gellanilyticum TaxID=748857 RepID=A0A366HTW3_9BACT|nr:hypothetical protein DES53_101324 [Roseimicrobium gellanilyticum]